MDGEDFCRLTMEEKDLLQWYNSLSIEHKLALMNYVVFDDLALLVRFAGDIFKLFPFERLLSYSHNNLPSEVIAIEGK